MYSYELRKETTILNSLPLYLVVLGIRTRNIAVRLVRILESLTLPIAEHFHNPYVSNVHNRLMVGDPADVNWAQCSDEKSLNENQKAYNVFSLKPGSNHKHMNPYFTLGSQKYLNRWNRFNRERQTCHKTFFDFWRSIMDLWRNLCLSEKLLILKRSSEINILNKRDELVDIKTNLQFF